MSEKFVARLASAPLSQPETGGITATRPSQANSTPRRNDIELEEKYCEIAANRLRQEALPLEVA